MFGQLDSAHRFGQLSVIGVGAGRKKRDVGPVRDRDNWGGRLSVQVILGSLGTGHGFQWHESLLHSNYDSAKANQ